MDEVQQLIPQLDEFAMPNWEALVEIPYSFSFSVKSR